MNKADLIPLADAEHPTRENPMVWTGEENAQGVFLDTGEALDLLGTPSLQAPPVPRLPVDFTPGPELCAWLERLRSTTHAVAAGAAPQSLDVAGLDAQSRQAVEEMLGQGEVSGSLTLDGVCFSVNETVLPGLWWVRDSRDNSCLEVASIPRVVESAAASLAPAPVALPEAGAVPGVMNALAVLAEINEHAAAWDGGEASNRVLNFTLMPMSPEDLRLLIQVLGRADLALESGGFGRCRVMATTVRHVWAVQYLNAMDNTILDTVEIGRIPDSALAAGEDLEDSARRLDDILDTYLV